MSTEEEVLADLTQAFYLLNRVLHRLRERSRAGQALNDRRIEVGEAMRDLLRSDPQASAARGRLAGPEWERRITVEDRNHREQQERRDREMPRDGVVPERSEVEAALDPEGLGRAQRGVEPLGEGPGRIEAALDPEGLGRARREAAEASAPQHDDVAPRPNEVEAALDPEGLGRAQLETERASAQRDGAAQGRNEVEAALDPENLGQAQREAEATRDGPDRIEAALDPEGVGQARRQALERDAAQRDDAVPKANEIDALLNPQAQSSPERTGTDQERGSQEGTRQEAPQQWAPPTADDRRERAESRAAAENQPGRHRPEVVEARLAEQRQRPTQEQTATAEGQTATGRDPAMSAELQKLRDLGQGGQRPAAQAAQRPTGTPEATPHGRGVTTAGQHHQRSSQQSAGRSQDTSSGRERT